LLDEVCAVCGYERKYAMKVLGCRREIAGGEGSSAGAPSSVTERRRERRAKRSGWRAEQPCGKRLKEALGLWLPHYEKEHGELIANLRE